MGTRDLRTPSISVSFGRREGKVLEATLFEVIERAVREAVEGTVFELVHIEGGGFQRGKGITQWP